MTCAKRYSCVTHHLKTSVTLLLDKQDERPLLRGSPLQSKKKLKNTNPLSYIDLLILTLTEHEKTLCVIIEKLEMISEKLEEISKQLTENKSQR